MASCWSAVLINSPGESFNSSPSRETSTKLGQESKERPNATCQVSYMLYLIYVVWFKIAAYIIWGNVCKSIEIIELVLAVVFLPLPLLLLFLLLLCLLLVVVEHLLKSAKFASSGRLKWVKESRRAISPLTKTMFVGPCKLCMSK